MLDEQLLYLYMPIWKDEITMFINNMKLHRNNAKSLQKEQNNAREWNYKE